jgi:hypothetical protein
MLARERFAGLGAGLRTQSEDRRAFIEAFGTLMAKRKIAPRPAADVFASFHRHAAGRPMAAEKAAGARALQVIEQIVGPEDIEAVISLSETLDAVNRREPESPIFLRLIPAAPEAARALAAWRNKGIPAHVFIRDNVELSAAGLARDFDAWRAGVPDLAGRALRLAIGLSDGVTVEGAPDGDSLYAQALRAALGSFPMRPVDFRNLLAIVEAVQSAA